MNEACLFGVHSTRNTIEFLLSPNRDLIAAKGFLQLALSAVQVRPRVINVDGHPAYASAISESIPANCASNASVDYLHT